MRCRFLLLPILLCALSPLSGTELARPTVAKFLKLLLQSMGGKPVACNDKELAGELAALGVPMSPEAKCVWMDADKDLPRLLKEGRMVICGSRPALAAGAAMALVAEEGRPAIYVNPKALASSGVSLPDHILKIAKVAQ